MTNLDMFNAKKDELLSKITDSISANDAEAMKSSLNDWQNFLVEEFNAAKAEFEATADRNILAARGARQLTVEETKFYEDFIKSAKAADDPEVTGVVTNTMKVLPQTVITSVLEDIKKNHPLLAIIDFQNTHLIAAAVFWKSIIAKSG